MKKMLLWVLLIFALLLYSLVVYSWWQEGNRNFERQRREQQNESVVFRH